MVYLHIYIYCSYITLSQVWVINNVYAGSNTGIGKPTALDLAKRGARVILACRNKQRAEAAVYDIRKVNPSINLNSSQFLIHWDESKRNNLLYILQESGNSEVLYMHLDLASLQSVRDFAETFLKSEPRLDLLINNAGNLRGNLVHESISRTWC